MGGHGCRVEFYGLVCEAERGGLIAEGFGALSTFVSLLCARVRAALMLSHWTAMCNGVSAHPSGCHAEAGLKDTNVKGECLNRWLDRETLLPGADHELKHIAEP